MQASWYHCIKILHHSSRPQHGLSSTKPGIDSLILKDIPVGAYLFFFFEKQIIKNASQEHLHKHTQKQMDHSIQYQGGVQHSVRKAKQNSNTMSAVYILYW